MVFLALLLLDARVYYMYVLLSDVISLPNGESHLPCPQKNREVVLWNSMSSGVGVGHLLSSSLSLVSVERALPVHSISSNSALNSGE